MALSVFDGSRVAVATRSEVATARFWGFVVAQPSVSPCLFWCGAISNRGHGRFWLGAGRVIIAHRFAWALAYGADSLEEAPVLAHACDNPLCVNVEHLRPSTAAANAAEWSQRRSEWFGPLADRRGTRGRAWAIRDGLRAGRPLADLLDEGKTELERGQLALW